MISICHPPRKSEHEPMPGPQCSTRSLAEEMGRRFLGQMAPLSPGYELDVEVSYFDVEMRLQKVRVEHEPDAMPRVLGDMHHAAVAIVEEGGIATAVDVAGRLRWFEKGPGGYRTGRIDWRRAETACIAGVEQGIIGIGDGGLYTARVEDDLVGEMGE